MSAMKDVRALRAYIWAANTLDRIDFTQSHHRRTLAAFRELVDAIADVSASYTISASDATILTDALRHARKIVEGTDADP